METRAVNLDEGDAGVPKPLEDGGLGSIGGPTYRARQGSRPTSPPASTRTPTLGRRHRDRDSLSAEPRAEVEDRKLTGSEATRGV
jgi:hypothetical protein